MTFSHLGVEKMGATGSNHRTKAALAVFVGAFVVLLIAPAAFADVATDPVGSVTGTAGSAGSTATAAASDPTSAAQDPITTVTNVANDAVGTATQVVNDPIHEVQKVADTAVTTVKDAASDPVGTVTKVLDHTVSSPATDTAHRPSARDAGPSAATAQTSRSGRPATSTGAHRAATAHKSSSHAPGIAPTHAKPAVSTVSSPTVGSRLGRAAVEAAKKLAFPLLLTVLVIAFLIAQSKVDSKDPKLALAPVDSHQDLLTFK
jgi:hypothetical protein